MLRGVPELSATDHAGWLIDQSDRFADLLGDADLERRVPDCPDWNLRELVTHIGRGHRIGQDLIRQGLTEPAGPFDPELIPVPTDAVELAGWLRAGARELVDAVASVGPERPVWNYLGLDQRAGFWVRRMAHDTAVHRSDACVALGEPFELSADLAADAVSEWLMIVNSPGAAAMRPDLADEMRGDGQTLHLHSTDEPNPGEPGLGERGEWLIRRGPDGVSWEHGHAKGDVAVRGRAADLLLALLGRIGIDDDRLQVFGDRALIEHWVRHVTF